MLRRNRRRGDEEPNENEGGSEFAFLFALNETGRRAGGRRCSRRGPRRTACCWSALLAVLTVYVAVRSYYALELWLDDPFLEAKLITPFSYVSVRFLEKRPRGEPLVATMRRNNTFVLNLDKDVERFRSFETVNRRRTGRGGGAGAGAAKNATTDANSANSGGTGDEDEDSPYYQRFPAYQWMPPDDSKRSATGKIRGSEQEIPKIEGEGDPGEYDVRRHQRQEEAMKRYPFLRYSVQRAEYGNAGCTYTHIQLLEKLAGLPGSRSKEGDGEDGKNYFFIFEDDARLSRELVERGSIRIPPDTDIALLSPTATKTVRVPYYEHHRGDEQGERGENDGQDAATAVRVLQSYGAFAYLITDRGARKVLRHLRGRWNDDPIDVAFHRAHRIRIYQPLGDAGGGRPLAWHGSHRSTRRDANG